jgi:hypothetical protein
LDTGFDDADEVFSSLAGTSEGSSPKFGQNAYMKKGGIENTHLSKQHPNAGLPITQRVSGSAYRELIISH